jgi:glycosyltransferase involved in cell wall biosynthesis
MALFCLRGLESFIGDIVPHLSSRFEICQCFSREPAEIEKVLDWADVVWLEWANELTAYITGTFPQLGRKKVLCRVHSYEILSGFLPKIKWSVVDRTIFVSNHTMQIAQRFYPSLTKMTDCVVVHNGVNLEKFRFKVRKPGFNIAVLGSVNHKKNPPMWVEILARLVAEDSRYTLKVAGDVQDVRYLLYFQNIIPKLHLQNRIKLCGRVSDVPLWFEKEDINYLLSTSVFESFGYGIAEAMAMGYKPLIHDYLGALEMWPRENIFRTCADVLKMIVDDENYRSARYRQFIEKRYALTFQLQRLDSLFDKLLAIHPGWKRGMKASG